MLRKHLQYVARAEFDCDIPKNKEYSRLVNKFVTKWSSRKNCDIQERQPLSDLIEMIELSRVIDGDIGIVLTERGKIQLIEADRIKTPADKADDPTWINGVHVDNYGRPLKFGVAKRDGTGFTDERIYENNTLILAGYYQRVDQVRGVSLFAPAANNIQDVYENIEFALAKVKMSQKIGLSVTSELEPEDNFNDTVKESFGEGTAIYHGGVNDRVQIIESATPSTQFREFTHDVIQITMTSLDLPYSFYDCSEHNYYGNRGAFDNYIDGCKRKQTALLETMMEITDWRIRYAVARGQLPQPEDYGLTMDDVLWHCDWIGVTLPAWRLIEDAKGFLIADQAGYLSTKKICGLYGTRYNQNIDENKERQQYAGESGMEMPQNKDINVGV
jgi:capsid protein